MRHPIGPNFSSRPCFAMSRAKRHDAAFSHSRLRVSLSGAPRASNRGDAAVNASNMWRSLVTGEWAVQHTNARQRRVLHYWFTILWFTAGLVVWIALHLDLFLGIHVAVRDLDHSPGRLGGRDTCRAGGRCVAH